MENFYPWLSSLDQQNDSEDLYRLFSAPPPPMPAGGLVTTNNPTFKDDVVSLQGPPLLPQKDLNLDNTAGKLEEGSRRQNSPAAAQGESSTSDDKQKKMIHRDIERQRRQEMASLYASLRSQLPLEYIKGKRSASDHVLEAAKYIEHKHKSIRELEEKRDRLKRLKSVVFKGEDESIAVLPAMVTVQPCLANYGVEILINSGSPKQGFRVSRALSLLAKQGLNVISCVCSRVEDRMLHTIRAEVSTQTRVDLQELHQNLIYALNNKHHNPTNNSN